MYENTQQNLYNKTKHRPGRSPRPVLLQLVYSFCSALSAAEGDAALLPNHSAKVTVRQFICMGV